MPIIGVIDSAKTGNLITSSYESIATVTVGAGGSSSITFSSIPQTYTHLQMRGILKTNRPSSTTAGVGIRINGSVPTQNYYTYHALIGNGATVSAGASAPRDNLIIGDAAGNTAASGIFGVYIVDILDYSNTNKYKTVRTLNGIDLNGSGNINLISGLYMFTTAITSITLKDNDDTSNFQQYSSFALYGIKG